MRYLMRSNATHGSASFANIPGYYVGGKTGTADKIIHGRYSQDRVFTTFMAITPADKPKYLYLALYDDPQAAPGDYGLSHRRVERRTHDGRADRRIQPLEGIPPSRRRQRSRSPSSPDSGMEPTPTKPARSERNRRMARLSDILDLTAPTAPLPIARSAGLRSTAAKYGRRRVLRTRRGQGRRHASYRRRAGAWRRHHRRRAGNAARGCALRQGCRCARGACESGRAALSAPAGDHRRRDRHERQDLGGRIRCGRSGLRFGHEAASLGTIGIVSRRSCPTGR